MIGTKFLFFLENNLRRNDDKTTLPIYIPCVTDTIAHIERNIEVKSSIFDYIRQVGINDAYGPWRSTLGRERNPLIGGGVEVCTRTSSLCAIVQNEHDLRSGGGQHNLICVWMIIDGTLDEVERCAEWVKQECPNNDEMVFDFLTTNGEENEFLDGSLSLVVPAAWEPSGVCDFLCHLVSRFPRLNFWGSTLEFRTGEMEPWSGSKFVGMSGKFAVDRRQFEYAYDGRYAA